MDAIGRYKANESRARLARRALSSHGLVAFGYRNSRAIVEHRGKVVGHTKFIGLKDNIGILARAAGMQLKIRLGPVNAIAALGVARDL